jgi:hypothetical protein
LWSTVADLAGLPISIRASPNPLIVVGIAMAFCSLMNNQSWSPEHGMNEALSVALHFSFSPLADVAILAVHVGFLEKS